MRASMVCPQSCFSLCLLHHYQDQQDKFKFQKNLRFTPKHDHMVLVQQHNMF